MAYSDYGSFVFKNDVRRRDKEDIAVFDTDEGELPSGIRIFSNILKNRERNNNAWYNHSQHGVMGDANIRVACYKQGLPTIYEWEEGNEEPGTVNIGCKDEYEFEVVKFVYKGHKFVFIDADNSESGHYEATMEEPGGDIWRCIYDYGYGAGLTDTDD